MTKNPRAWGIASRLLIIACAAVGTAFAQGTMSCNSNDMGYHFCSVPNNGVRMVRQRSGSPCVRGRTWGYSGNGIWVDRGCRADFSVANSRYNGRGNGPYANGGRNDGYYDGYGADRRHDRDRDDRYRDRDRDDRHRDRDDRDSRDRDHNNDHNRDRGDDNR